jgi:O-antigen/teichoic acid export membrane protein
MLKQKIISWTPLFIRDLYFKYYKSNELTNRFARILSLDILVKGGLFFLYPIYIRLMSVEEYGVYGYLINIVSVFSLSLNFGMYIAQTKQYHDIGPERRGEYLFNINFFLILALSLSVAAIFLTRIDYKIISFLFEKGIDYSSYRNWIVLGIVNSIYGLMVYNYFMTSEQIGFYQLQNILKLVFVNAVAIYMMKMDIGDNVVVRLKYSTIMETLILLPFLFVYLRRIQPRLNIAMIRGALFIGIPSIISSIIGIVYSLADRKILEQYRSHEELGIYTLGIVLSGIIYMIFAAFQNSLLPFFYKEKDKKENYKRTTRAVKKMTLLLFASALLMFLTTVALTRFNIIKPEYGRVLPLMPVMLITQIVQSVSTLYSNYYVYFNKNYYSIILSVISSVLNIVLCLVFIPGMGMAGAVWATFIITGLMFLINYRFAWYNCMIKA